MASCPDCDGPAVFGGGNGKCGHCHGTGYEPVDMLDFAGSFIFPGQFGNDECSNCDGSGECQTCDGTGEVDDDDDSVTDYESSYSSGGSSYGGDYSHSGSSSENCVSTIIGAIIVAGLLLLVIICGGFANQEKGPPLVDISSTPPSQRPAMYVPAMRMPNENCVGLYLCTEENYDSDEWRVTSKTVSHTFDGGETWLKVWGVEDDSKYTILRMEAIDNREGAERDLRPNQRDIFLIIEEEP